MCIGILLPRAFRSKFVAVAARILRGRIAARSGSTHYGGFMAGGFLKFQSALTVSQQRFSVADFCPPARLLARSILVPVNFGSQHAKTALRKY